jgi:hypothetical protein
MDERRVRDAFRTAIVQYCNTVVASRRATEGLLISVMVTTVDALSIGTQEWIYDLARSHVRGMLRAEEPVVSFPAMAGLPEPGYQFVFHPPALPRPRTAQPESASTLPLPTPPPSGLIVLLTLHYETNFVWPCRIGAAANWLAICRWTGRTPPAFAAMQLPTYANWLPRGRLLLVRNYRGQFTFGRAADRPHYEIRIDGVPVHPGRSVEARDVGSIEYAADGSSTVLSYRVDWEVRHDR